VTTVAPTAGPVQRRSRRRRRERLTVLAFLAPWIAGCVMFFGYPLVATVYYSFTHYDLLSKPRFIGFANYRFLFRQDPVVWTAIHNTLWLVVVMVVTQTLFALGIAQLLVRIKTGASLFRTIFYLPSLVPPVAATLAFVFLFGADGPVNHALGAVGIDGPLWFNSPTWAKPSLTLLAMWGVGNLMVIFLASLLDVPVELYEAAMLDGANAWQRFRAITLPMISPVIVFAVVTGVIQTLQYFTQAVVASAVASHSSDPAASSHNLGYPDGSTMTFPEWLYQKGFHEFQMGYASALAMVLFVVSFAFTALLIARSRRMYAEEVAA
jgi:multiple sugar transport system permease protein